MDNGNVLKMGNGNVLKMGNGKKLLCINNWFALFENIFSFKSNVESKNTFYLLKHNVYRISNKIENTHTNIAHFLSFFLIPKNRY